MVKHLERIMEDKSNKCLIFVGTKRTADDITRVRYLMHSFTCAYIQYIDTNVSFSVKMDGHHSRFTVTKLRTNVTGY